MLNGITKNGGLLASFTLITTAILSFIYWLTAPRIEAQIQHRTEQLLHQVLTPSEFDNDLIASCTLVTADSVDEEEIKVYRATRNDKPVALILDTKTPNGYNGDIELLVSVKEDGTIGGVRVLEHAETPGLGDKIELRIDDWILSFSGQKASNVYEDIWAVEKDGGQFDQFTGATITPRAVVSGVESAVKFAMENQTSLYQAIPSCTKEPTS